MSVGGLMSCVLKKSRSIRLSSSLSPCIGSLQQQQKQFQFRHSFASSISSCSCYCFCSCCANKLTNASTLIKPSSPQLSPFRSFSSSVSSKRKLGADETLKKVIDSEIECAEESSDLDQGLPDLSPFEIVDNPGEQTITLKREFGGESIQVEVHMSEPDSEGDEDDDDDENPQQPNMSLIVLVSKGEGPYLEFCCTAYPDDITIDSMLMKSKGISDDQFLYEGPQFSDLDENLQKAFYKYLELRGIQSSLTTKLQEYMINKDNREYLRWLKNMKEFVSV